MEEANNDIWAGVLQRIQKGLPPQIFERWFQPTRLSSISEERVVVAVPDAFFKDWLLDHYGELIRTTLEEVAHRKLAIEFSINSANSASPQAESETQPSPDKQPSAELVERFIPAAEFDLNPKFTFDSFVVGSSNRFAHAASLAVAESPAKAYNPLFIYGGVGLGKTHLMQAIGHYLIKKHPQSKILYISSEKFTNQLINAIQNRTTLKFREKYRGVDVLLVDDIHFIAGKESTQEEFFHTFNALYDSHKQIVISSDRLPKEIPMLESRLVSRFGWGLVTDIQPPDLETRIAIMRKKAEREGIEVPEDVTYYIAERIRSNIRELEGALIRIVAYSRLVGSKITIGLVKEVLKDAFKEAEKRITIDLIQKKVAEYFDIRLSDMKAKKRTRAVAYPRQIAMYITRELTDYSLPEIGEQFGGRDHTTVLHACEKVQGGFQADQGIKNLVEGLIEEIKK